MNTRQRFSNSLLNLHTMLYNSAPEKFASVGQIESHVERAMIFETARIHFLIDVFAICQFRRRHYSLNSLM